MTRRGRRAFLGLLRRPDPAPPTERVLPEMPDEEVAARLAQLDPGRPRIREKARPGHLDRLLGREPVGAPTESPTARRSLPVLPVIRPPGAVPERAFVERCDACGACAEACPHDAIVGLDARHGPFAGTPTIVGRDAPCQMCDDLPCIASCDRGALTSAEPTVIGVAEIRQFDCMAWSGAGCSTCAERCPARAIARTPGQPRVNTDACTGCGICQHVCPAPRNAVLLVAREERVSS